jgi:hypothetical protein
MKNEKKEIYGLGMKKVDKEVAEIIIQILKSKLNFSNIKMINQRVKI